MKNIAVLLTVHNRKVTTLLALERLQRQESLAAAAKLDVFLVDDGSTDGTTEEIAFRFPEVHLYKGDGDLYWNGGMRIAFAEALKRDFDYYLWLNDDTHLYPNAISRLLGLSSVLGSELIIIGSIQDPESKQLTYGGVKRVHKWHPLKFTRVVPSDEPILVDTMNGNCVLIPNKIAKAVGNLDEAFTHGIGDYDYGLRASALGFKVMVAPGFLGTCKRNSLINTWEDPKVSLSQRWEKLRGPHGLPPHDWYIFARRYAGFLWFIYWPMPYLRSLLPNPRKISAFTDKLLK